MSALLATVLRVMAKESHNRRDADSLRMAADDLDRLREATRTAITLIDDNLYHQRERVEDAASLLRQALDPVERPA